ncbi:MAG: SGNH/GDSL hydrolase family protein [Actinomycetes bacterium]
MTGLVRVFAVLGLAAVLGSTVSPPTATAAESPVPASMTALGDSITRGFNANGWYVDAPSRSWSAGGHASVNSHYLRIKARNSAITGHNYNDARTGAKASALPGQASSAVSRDVDYVTVLIGANDACTSTASTMTPVPTFRSYVDTAMNRLDSGLPDAKVLVVSIPDIRRLWQVGKDSWAARTAWDSYGICQSMLANPRSTTEADVDRRARVRQRVVNYNTQLAAECAQHARCRYDGGAVFGYPFALSQLSSWDYFHPNTGGQAALARVSNVAGFGW